MCLSQRLNCACLGGIERVHSISHGLLDSANCDSSRTCKLALSINCSSKEKI